MNVTFAQLYREFKKCPTFSMTKDQFLLWLMRKVVDGTHGRWQSFTFDTAGTPPSRYKRCYLHVDTLMQYYRQYTTNLEKKK